MTQSARPRPDLSDRESSLLIDALATQAIRARTYEESAELLALRDRFIDEPPPVPSEERMAQIMLEHHLFTGPPAPLAKAAPLARRCPECRTGTMTGDGGYFWCSNCGYQGL